MGDGGSAEELVVEDRTAASKAELAAVAESGRLRPSGAAS